MNNYWYVDDGILLDDVDSSEEGTRKKTISQTETYAEDEVDNSNEYSNDNKVYDTIIVTLMPEFRNMVSLELPIIAEGKRQFEGDVPEKMREGSSIMAFDNAWYLHCLSPICITNMQGEYFTSVKLHNQDLYFVNNVEEKCTIYVDYTRKDQHSFHNFQMRDKSEFVIGSSEDCDIVYCNAYIKEKHALIKYVNHKWYVTACDHEVVFYLNGRKTKDAKFEIGDLAYFMGLKIIMGINFLSVNSRKPNVRITSSRLKEILSTEDIVSLSADFESKDEEEILFNRLPRRRMPLNNSEINIEAPPMSMNDNRIPLLLRMGSSMLMGASSAMMGHYMMMLNSVLFPVLNSKYTDKQKKEYEKRRKEKYTEYLSKKKSEIIQEKDKEEKIMNYNYPELNQVLQFPYDGKRLWERRKIDDDFLNIRLGHGSISIMAEYKYPEQRFDLDEDPLEAEMYELVENKVNLDNVPIMNNFIENYVCGILGSKRLTKSFIERLIMQIVMTHSYDEVKTVFLLSKKDLESMEYIKYMPHSWNDQKTFRFIATEIAEVYQISEYLQGEIEEALVKNEKLKSILNKRPYYIIFALDKKLFDCMEVLKEVMQLEENSGISIVTAFDDLPKECFTIFDLKSDGHNSLVYLKELDRESVYFKMDYFDDHMAKDAIKKMSNTKLKIVSQAYSLPKMITFLEMFGVGRIEHLNPLERWKINNPVKSLATPVGVATDGTLFNLDLHEKFQGPHGLIAGMTGSGKSEFIITYILSMAINYHPDEVSFLLIDYKGGGLARAFEDKERGIRLPHLVGTITNLDGAAIQRSLISIQSENMRRQRIFNDVKSKIGESSVDIYDYQALYRSGKVEEPLPHLFIIADEFAELKQQEPEFMDKLISTARIGRSLGVHLILATQKPAGIVNDQIRSNTKFRICLKVQDRFDSMDMLKRPEAAEIKETGRFYLQVGYNEYFALGQSAWSGAQYEPQDEVLIKKDESIQFVDTLGQNILEIKKDKQILSKGKSQLTEIVWYLMNLAKKNGIKTRQLWKKPLGNRIYLNSLMTNQKRSTYEIVIGRIDNPKEQKQETLVIKLNDYKNTLIIGEAGSGKTNFIQTILYSVSISFLPDDVHYYVIETNGNSLSIFSKLPHCGGVVNIDDENEFSKLLNLLGNILEERKRLFKEYNSNNFQTFLKKYKIPLVLVAIDGYIGISSLKNNMDVSLQIVQIMREGLNYGIRFIITANHLNECTSKIRQETERRFALRVKDRFAYGEILGERCALSIPEIPGRGICVMNKQCVEFHVAIVGKENSNKGYLRESIDSVACSLKEYKPARRIPKVDNQISYSNFMREFKLERIPLGYDLRNGDKIAIPFQQLFCMSLYFGTEGCIKYVLNNLLDEVYRENGEMRLIRKNEHSVLDNEKIKKEFSKNGKSFKSTLEGLNKLNKLIMQDIQERNKYKEKSCIEHNLIDWKNPEAIKVWRQDLRANTKPIFVLIESFKEFCMNINGELSGMFSTYFELCRGYNIYFFACFYPHDDISLNELAYKEFDDEEEKKRSNYIFKLMESFNKERFGMLFGGKFNLQRIFNLPAEWSHIVDPCSSKNYNKALLSYNNKIYNLLMPCGKLESDNIPEDEKMIIV